MGQSRFRSKVAWVAVSALVLFLLKNYGLLGGVGLTEGAYDTFVNLLFGVLTTFGIFNDPTNKNGF